ncbi:hypothetical protein BKA64DRAFT_301987 [Cadophora sp. MPI-SDFR-AT-0126]|nr:hypothetical protein BKA64DRAFT_301987 [Leotiomycetes sp. MPI-SDFR-AT-0126]
MLTRWPAASTSIRSLRWLQIRTVLGSFGLQPIRWYREKRQVAEGEKKRIEELYSVIKNSPRGSRIFGSNHIRGLQVAAAIEHFQEGWPQLAAFLHSEDNFAVFRRFGVVHCRVLVQLQAEIQHLEERLKDLDCSDAAPGSPHVWRLNKSDFVVEDSDSTQRDLLKTLQDKLLIYDQLLLNEKELRHLGNVTEKDHTSVFNWMIWEKPLAYKEATWIHHQADCIPLSRIDPKMFRSNGKEKDGIIKRYSLKSVTITVKLFFVLLAVSILTIPVFILMWGPNTKATISATVLISVLIFAALMTLFTKATVQAVLVGTAA